MATLQGNAIGDSFDQIVALPSGGGQGTSLVAITDGNAANTFALQLATDKICIDNPTTSAADQGGLMRLQSDDGAALGSGHRLGVVEFSAAEDSSNNIVTGAHIEAIADDAFTATGTYDHATRLEFAVQNGTSGNDGLSSPALVIDSNSNIGINTNTPGSTLPDDANSTTPRILEIKSVGTSTDVGIMFSRSDGYSVGGDMWYDISEGVLNIDNRYNHADGDIRFRTKTAAPGGDEVDVMTLEASGKVGIGTTSPGYDLEIKGGAADDTSTGGGQLALTGTDAALGDGDDLGTIYFCGSDSTLSSPPAVGAKIVAEAAGDWNNSSANDAPTELQFWTTDDGTTNALAQKVVINADGKVGIGSTAPLQQLHIAGATPMIQLEDSNATNTPYCLIDCSDGNLALKADDANETSSSNISLQVDGSAKMTVLANGNVGIGVADPDAALEVYGDQGTGQFIAKFHHYGGSGSTYNRHGLEVWAGRDDGATSGHGITYYMLANDGDGGAVGSIVHDTDTDFKIVETSDERLKKNIADSKIVGLDIVNNIKVREFNWKKRGGAFNPAGFIAQEVAKVYPRAAVGEPDGDSFKEPMGVSDTSFIAPMIKAIQELSARVIALENA